MKHRSGLLFPALPCQQGRQHCMGAVFERGKTENFIRWTPDLGVQNANLQAY